MEGVVYMFDTQRVREIRYIKPNMGALRGRIGREILETIRNTPKPDLTELNRQADEVETRILAARQNG